MDLVLTVLFYMVIGIVAGLFARWLCGTFRAPDPAGWWVAGILLGLCEIVFLYRVAMGTLPVIHFL